MNSPGAAEGFEAEKERGRERQKETKRGQE
jgi:hypothetical protein